MSGLLTSVKCVVGVILSVIIYAIFFIFYKSVGLQYIHNPYVGLVILVVALLAVLVAGFVLAFKLLEKWE